MTEASQKIIETLAACKTKLHLKYCKVEELKFLCVIARGSRFSKLISLFKQFDSLMFSLEST